MNRMIRIKFFYNNTLSTNQFQICLVYYFSLNILLVERKLNEMKFFQIMYIFDIINL